MKKLIFVTILLAISIFLAVKSQEGDYSFIPNFSKTSTQPKITIDGHQFNTEIAKSDKDKQTGLTKYQSLPAQNGMYFPFPKEDRYAFWMKNMKFPIDIIYIDKNVIVDIKESVPPADPTNDNPPVYTPSHVANAVLEINSGLCEKYGFKIGDKVQTQGI